MELPIILLLLTCCQLVAGKTETFFAAMDSGGKYNVTWSFDDVEPDSYVTFTVSCKTSGWVGLGMSPKGTMDDADIVFAWVDSTGKVFLKDTYINGHGRPSEDTSQDIQLVSAAEQDGVTTVTFKRKIDTCDKEKDHKIEKSTTRLIFAYASEDPADNMISKANKHHTRGVKSLYLLDPSSKLQTPPDDVKHFDMRVNNYKVPSTHTTYYCSFYDVPSLNSKHHVVAIEPLLTEGNEALVHHILIYGCLNVAKEHLRNSNKTEGVCNTNEMPEFAASCRNPIHAWAIGGTKVYLPQNTGYPLGASDGSTPEYFMMEMHYDNLQKLDTWVDSSGIRFIYTPTLRTDDTGVLQIGITDGIVVPPRPDKFRTTTFCHSMCSATWIPKEGITIYGYGLHTHLLGVRVDVEWFRDGKFIGLFVQDKAYDFNFQEYRLMPKPEKVLPGDTLKVTCTYSDSKRDTVTYGGLPTTSEMCLAFLLYYPKQQISACGSLPNLIIDSRDPFFTATNLDATSTGGLTTNLYAVSSIKNWTKDTVALLQEVFEKTKQYSVCAKTSDANFFKTFHPFDVTNYISPPEEEAKEDKTCTGDDGKLGDGENGATVNTLFPPLQSLVFAFLIFTTM